MTNDINNIKNYSRLLFNSGPVQTMDFINSKYDIIHKELYNFAINNFITALAQKSYDNIFILNRSKISNLPTDNGYGRLTDYEGQGPNYEEYIRTFIKNYKDSHKFIEIKKDEYFAPSDVIVINVKFPYERKKYNLSNYWNTITEKRNNKDVSLMQFSDETVKYAELVYIDYVNGKCKFKSKLTGEEFWTTFDYINEDTKISDSLSLKDTFMYKIRTNNTIKSTQ